MSFNARFLALREVKRRVLTEINAKGGALRDITAQLALLPGGGGGGGAGGGGKDLGKAAAVVFSSELSLRPEEQPEMREVGERAVCFGGFGSSFRGFSRIPSDPVRPPLCSWFRNADQPYPLPAPP